MLVRIDAFNAQSKGDRRRNNVFAFVPPGANPEFKPEWLRSSPKTAFAELCDRCGGDAVAVKSVNEGQFILAEFHLYVEKDKDPVSTYS